MDSGDSCPFNLSEKSGLEKAPTRKGQCKSLTPFQLGFLGIALLIIILIFNIVILVKETNLQNRDCSQTEAQITAQNTLLQIAAQSQESGFRQDKDSLVTMRNDIKTLLQTAENEKGKCKTQLAECSSSLLNVNFTLQATKAAMNDQKDVIKHEVAFSAGLTKETRYTDDQIVVYDKIYANVGSGYDNTNGVFTCPIAGMYMIQFHAVTLTRSTYFWMDLRKNGDYVATFNGEDGHNFSSGGNAVIIRLQEGDQLYIASREKSALNGHPDEVVCIFSGFLIYRSE